MNKWPNWFSGLALGVEHLVGLEDYLLARIQMADHAGHGVEYFNWETSVTLQEERGNWELKVLGPIRGVTPGGHPVVIDVDQAEIVSLDVPYHGRLVLDLTIEIHPDDAKSRLQLKVVPTINDADEIKSEQANALYLGRVQFEANNGKHLLKKPLVRRFSSLQPPNEAWVRPFVTRLTDVLRRLEHEAESGNRGAAKAVSALSEVAFDWPHWPLPQLARRLSYALWLASGASEPQAIGDATQPAPSFPPTDAIGDDIPRLLAKLLVVPVMPRTLPDLLDQLLYGLYLKVPIQDFLSWEEYLGRTGREINFDLVAQTLRQALKRKQFTNWSRAIGLITMARLQENSLYEWPADILKGYLVNPKNSLAADVGSILQKLYKEEARQAPAGPLGFYCLARAARGIALNMQDRDDLLYYLRLVTTKVPPRTGQAGRLDRVLEFLEQRIRLTANLGHSDALSNPLDAKWTPIDPPEHAIPEVRIHVLGEKGSGKSALVRAYIGLLGGGNISAKPSGSAYISRGALGDNESVVSCQICNTEITFRFVENSIEAENAIAAADPISHTYDAAIFVIDPESIDVARDVRPTGVRGPLSLLFPGLRKREPFMTIIVYSKSDEYGVLNPDVIRVGGNAVNWSMAKAWSDFVQQATASGSDTKWNESRKMVLNETREYWTELSELTGPMMSGYFVAAQPIETGARFGLLESLNDLCDHSVQNVVSRH